MCGPWPWLRPVLAWLGEDHYGLVSQAVAGTPADRGGLTAPDLGEPAERVRRVR
jgi:hypothetical protein